MVAADSDFFPPDCRFLIEASIELNWLRDEVEAVRIIGPLAFRKIEGDKLFLPA
jgi:hypothetical protein